MLITSNIKTTRKLFWNKFLGDKLVSDSETHHSLNQTFFILILFLSFSVLGFNQDTNSTYIGFPNEAIRLTNLAISNLEQKEFSEAHQLLLQAIANDKSHRGAYLQLYKVCAKTQKNINEVIDLIESAKLIFPEDDELCYYVGDLYRMIFDFEKAIIGYSKAIELSKINGQDFYLVPYYYFNRANSYLKTGKYNKALLDYDNTLKLEPYFYACLSNKGITFYQLGKKKEACDCWKNGAEQDQLTSIEYFDKYCKK